MRRLIVTGTRVQHKQFRDMLPSLKPLDTPSETVVYECPGRHFDMMLKDARMLKITVQEQVGEETMLLCGTLCHCGQPLHYTSEPMRLFVEARIKELGPDRKVIKETTGEVFLVPRHYIALHGLTEDDLDSLEFKRDELGH